ESWLTGHDAALVLRFAIRAEHRKIDPRESGMKSRAPYDVRDVEHATVFEQRPAVADARHSRHTVNAGGGEILRLDSDEPRCFFHHRPPRRATDGIRRGQNAVEHDARHAAGEDEASGQAVDAERDVAGVASGEPRRATADGLERDLGAGISGADDEDGSVLELRRIAVVDR